MLAGFPVSKKGRKKLRGVGCDARVGRATNKSPFGSSTPSGGRDHGHDAGPDGLGQARPGGHKVSQGGVVWAVGIVGALHRRCRRDLKVTQRLTIIGLVGFQRQIVDLDIAGSNPVTHP